MTLPTRDDVIAVLTPLIGQGQQAMRDAVIAMKLDYPDMTDEMVSRIIGDLLSYSEYTDEL